MQQKKITTKEIKETFNNLKKVDKLFVKPIKKEDVANMETWVLADTNTSFKNLNTKKYGKLA
ncbi:MAG: hypothetical protein PHR47_01120 [Candidatus Pacebacteria bacterium]|nr:hypothetical protein [Candidatus Paceibacterota bacterium]